ncbi:MAG: hypothetical protein BWY32_03567 [bacterium ADurb.Bin243]|nr:MAG: hypothetical protein BWY32_03567 [bacterium ADurb.Bin243]
MKKIKIFTFAIAVLSLAFWFNNGCSNDKLQLGIQEESHYISKIKAYRSGGEVNTIAGVRVGEHVIIEGRAFNQNNTSVEDGAISISSTDEKIAKVLTVYRSDKSYYGVVRGEAVGSIEIILAGGNITLPVFFGVSTTSGGDNKPYIKFKTVSTEPIAVGTARQYNANYIDSKGAVSTTTALVWSLVPANEAVAKIASQTKDTAVIQGIATGEVELLVKDAENTVASSVTINVK